MASPRDLVYLEDQAGEALGFHDGLDRFQRTTPAVPASMHNHVYAENPRKPGQGKVYIPIRYQHQEFPKMLYTPRFVPSREIGKALEVVVQTKDPAKRQDLWDKFLDVLTKTELDIDFRQLALPSAVPEPMAVRLLKRTLILQVQSAEIEDWKAKNNTKTHEEYKIFVNTNLNTIVQNETEQKALGAGWFFSPNCAPGTEVNRGS
jgi:hypothetical protein